MSSFQGVGIECIQRCPHFRGEERSSTVYKVVLISGDWNREVPLYTEMSSFQGGSSTVHRGAFISRCWNRGVPLYAEVSLILGGLGAALYWQPLICQWASNNIIDVTVIKCVGYAT